MTATMARREQAIEHARAPSATSPFYSVIVPVLNEGRFIRQTLEQLLAQDSSAERFVRPQSVAVAYRREVFDTVGFFDEQFDACEDVEFNERVARAGLSCFFSPHVQVQYHPRDTLGGLFRQMARYGRGRMRL